jgi:hypothetical protein
MALHKQTEQTLPMALHKQTEQTLPMALHKQTEPKYATTWRYTMRGYIGYNMPAVHSARHICMYPPPHATTCQQYTVLDTYRGTMLLRGRALEDNGVVRHEFLVHEILVHHLHFPISPISPGLLALVLVPASAILALALFPPSPLSVGSLLSALSARTPISPRSYASLAPRQRGEGGGEYLQLRATPCYYAHRGHDPGSGTPEGAPIEHPGPVPDLL